MSYLYKSCLLAFLYIFFGKMGMSFIVPSAHFSIFAPEAGIALAGILIFGYRFWPILFVASYLLNSYPNFTTANVLSIFDHSIPHLIIASVASGQAVVGAFLIRFFIQTSLSLEKEESILKFFFFGGLVNIISCTFLGTAFLIFTDAFKTELFMLNWGIWSLGSMFGTFIIAPLFMVFGAEPREIWRSRKISLTLPIVALLCLILIIFSLMNKQRQHLIRTEIDSRYSKVVNKIKTHLESYLETLQSFETSYKSNDTFNKVEFSKLAKPILKRSTCIGSLWVSIVESSSRNHFEQTIKSEFPDFKIMEFGYENTLISNHYNDYYFPITYAEPLKTHSNSLGLNLASDSTIYKALTEAAQKGEIVITEPLKLPSGIKTILACLPIYKNEPSPVGKNKMSDLNGFVIMLIDIEKFISKDLAPFIENINHVNFVDKDSPNGELEIFSSEYLNKNLKNEKPSVHPNTYSYEDTFVIGNHHWKATIYPKKDVFNSNKNITVWYILLGGFSLISFFMIILLIITGRQTLINGLVEQRTAELAKANQELDKYKEELLKLSITDPLTGLLNRRGFELYSKEHIKIARRKQLEMFILFIDLDIMKKVNDTYGHKEGDHVLIEVAKILTSCFRGTDVIARLGGDEFCILMTMNEEKKEIIYQRLKSLVDTRNADLGSLKLPISISTGGIICDPYQEFDLEEMLAKADQMMYVQKQAKKKLEII